MIWPKKYLPTYILTHIPTYPPTYLPNRTPSRSNPGDLWPLRHLIRVMRRHDLTEKIPTYQHTYPPTYLPTSLTEHPQRAILETCDHWDIWSEWWRYMTWPRKYLPTYIPIHLPTYPSTYLPASFTEHPQGAIPETCDLWDTDNNSDNWEPESMTIFVIWQSIVTLDSIRNSCDVSYIWGGSECYNEQYP